MTRPSDRHPRRNAVMPDRARLELRVDPEPVYREPRSRWNALLWIVLGLAWVVGIVLAALIIAVLVGSSIEAPRGAQTTDLAPSRDLSATSRPSAGLPGAPRPQAEQRRPGAPSSGSLAGGTDGANTAAGGDGSTPTPAGGAPRFRGLATWYCLSGSSACTAGYSGDDLVAAIDSDLGFGKGDRIRVRYGDRSVVVTVVDVCGCPGDRLVDLTSGAFARLAHLDVGVIPVTVELAGPNATLPATETTP